VSWKKLPQMQASLLTRLAEAADWILHFVTIDGAEWTSTAFLNNRTGGRQDG
jgi:hypothetical protein